MGLTLGTRRSGVVMVLSAISALLALGGPLARSAAARVPTRAHAATTSTFTLELGRESFTPTGIELAGSSASITVSGNGKCGEGSDCPLGASGGGGQTCANRKLGPLTPGQAGPNVPYGSVAARVGKGPVSVVGPSGKVSGTGELQLIYADCSGYYGDNTGSYTVTVTYTAAEEKTKLGGSFVAVQCTISTVAPTSSTCTAQVAGYGSSHPVSPTGTVTFAAASGTVGSACALAATPGSPGVSSCTVSYLPAASLTPGTPPPVSAHYSGDANFGPASGESSFVPRSVLLFEGESVSSTTEVADGESSEGIPVDLTNPNPFPVSADEELTVSGYPPVANSSSATALAARTQAIGRVVVKLGPLKTVATKVKLSRGGAKLLKRHKHLKTTLVVVTKRAGQRSSTARHKLLVKA
jgi:hypothetical protein